jgi:hypothetical protein
LTDDEARTVGLIACQADGGCPVCSADLVRNLQKKFPAHAETFGAAYRGEFERGLDED